MSIDTETIKEITHQLSLLYGHAVTDIMPIVLHAISLLAIARIGAITITLIGIGVVLKYIYSGLRHLYREGTLDLVEVFGIGTGLLGITFVVAVVLKAIVNTLFSSIIYSAAPHTYIVAGTLGKI